MGIYNQYESSDKIYHNTPYTKIVVNDLDNTTQRDKNIINNFLMLEVGEFFDNVPSCQCGDLNMVIYKGIKCIKCNTIVEEAVSADLDSKIWVRAPKGVPALMNPKMWYQLQEHLMREHFKFNLLQWLTDPNYKPSITRITKPIELIFRRLDEEGLHVRNYQFFYDNFDRYINLLLTAPEFQREEKFFNQDKGTALLKLFQENRHLVWEQYVRIPNKALTIVESNNGKKWIDSSTPMLLKAVRLMVGIDNENNVRGGLSLKTKLSRTSKFLSSLADYYDREINPRYLGSKPGEIRKHVIATRSNFTGRFVATAIYGPHKYDEVRFPWVGFMGIFAPFIRAKIYHKYGYSEKTITHLMTKYQKTYHPMMHQVMLELIDECGQMLGKPGIPVLYNRNPTLRHTSIVLFRIPPVVGVKTDPLDLSISTSGTVAPLYNGDYDGDQGTVLAPIDQLMIKALDPFEAHYSVGSVLNPYQAEGVFSLPKPTVMALSSALVKRNEITPTPEQTNFMKQFSI